MHLSGHYRFQELFCVLYATEGMKVDGKLVEMFSSPTSPFGLDLMFCLIALRWMNVPDLTLCADTV